MGILLLKSVVCVFSIPYLTERLPCYSPLLYSPFQAKLTNMSDCYQVGDLGVLFISFSDLQFLCFYRYFGIYLFYWNYGVWRLFMRVNKCEFQDYYLFLFWRIWILLFYSFLSFKFVQITHIGMLFSGTIFR